MRAPETRLCGLIEAFRRFCVRFASRPPAIPLSCLSLGQPGMTAGVSANFETRLTFIGGIMSVRIYAFFMVLYAACLYLSGCASRNTNQIEIRERPEAVFENGTNRVYRRSGSYSMRTPDVITPTVTPASGGLTSEERSQKIAKAVTELDAIKSAAVVITGNTAIVGLQTDDNYTDSALIDIKRLVEERVKFTDKGIDHVSVTTSGELLGRINNMPDAGVSEDQISELPDALVP